MLHRFGINVVVLFVSSNELYKTRLARVVNRYDQPVLVSCYVEYDSATFENAR
jgi:hypothetical protein